MIEIYQALQRYQVRLRNSTLDNWPEVWAVHYAGDRYLGELFGPTGEGPAEAMFWLSVPFAKAVEVTSSFVFFEGYTAAGPLVELAAADPCLYATRYWSDGESCQTTHWIIPYRVTDDGVRLYDAPYKSPFFVPRVFDVVSVITDEKNRAAHYSYEEAVAAAIRGDTLE